MDAGPAAEVVDLNEGQTQQAPKKEEKPAAWGVTPETPHEPPAPTNGAPKPGDPEWIRAFPDEDGPAPKTAADKIAARKRGAARPGDPEFGRRWPGEGSDLDEKLVSDENSGGASAKKKADPVDRPRFVLGEGLDDENADLSVLGPLAVLPPDAHKVAVKKPEVPKAEPKKAKPNPKDKKNPKEPQTEAEEKADLDRKVAQIKAQQADIEAKREKLKAQDQAGAEKTKEEDGDEVITARTKPAAQAIRAMHDDRPVAQITGRVIDPDTKLPLPARVKIVDSSDTAAGSAIPDLGFWCEGEFQVPVAPGKIRVEIRAGRFRRMVLKDIFAEPGQVIPLQEELLRPAYLDFAKDGWYLADLNYALRARRGETPLWTGDPPGAPDAVLAARAEGVQVLGLAMPWTPEDEAAGEAETLEAFGSQARGTVLLPVLPGPQHPFCGSGLGVGMTKWKHIPRQLTDPRSPLRDAFEEIRRNGGLAVYTELSGRRSVDPRKSVLPLFPRLERDGVFTAKDTTALLYAPAELPFDTIVGPVYDALAFDGSETAQAIWFALLNEGYAIPIVGAGGGCLESGSAPDGQTFVHLDGAPTREKVLEACRTGRSFVSFGPALFARFLERDKGPGDRLVSDGSAWTLKIRAYASLQPGTSLERIELIRNGKVVHNEVCEDGMAALHDFRIPITEHDDAWYSVRVTERVEVQGQPKARRFALTNPVYFDTPGRTLPQPAKARINGTLRREGGTPTAGKVTVLEPGKDPRAVAVDASGKYSVAFTAAGAVIFEAEGCEPSARKAFDNPQTLKALGQVLAERDGKLRDQFTKPTTFGFWRMILSDWNEDVTLKPLPPAAAPPELEPEKSDVPEEPQAPEAKTPEQP
ncbi:MAG: hypothetical protein HY291_23795 [Planctomycetes bacterium]|nr:hypothetical protein [Planctomycetota bacterium]